MTDCTFPCLVSTRGLISTRVHSFSVNTLYSFVTTDLHSVCCVLPGEKPSDVARYVPGEVNVDEVQLVRSVSCACEASLLRGTRTDS